MSASSKKKLRKEQAAEQLTEKQLQQQKEAKTLKIYTITFVSVMALVLCVALVIGGYSLLSSSGILDRNTKAITIGEHELNSAELNYYFMAAVDAQYSEWYNSYGDYMSSYLSWLEGFDLSTPLNQQYYNAETGETYADHFADVAVQEATNAYALYDAAVAANHEMTEEENTNLQTAIENLELEAAIYTGGSVADYLKNRYGNGATVESYKKYLEVSFMAQSYYDAHNDSLVYDNDDLRAKDNDNYAAYSSFDYTYFYVDPSTFVEHNHEETDEEHVHTDEENAAALKAAEEAAKTLAASGAKTAEELDASIAELEVYAESGDTSIEHDNTLYSQINSAMAAWLAEEGRAEGDIASVPYTTATTAEDGTETTETTGYYVVIYRGRDDNNTKLVNARHILIGFDVETLEEGEENTEDVVTKEEALETLKEIQKTWEEGEKTEDSFAALADEKSEDSGSVGNGGLYEDIYPHQMVDAFNDWCFDETRKEGDTEIVETEYGYHLMYFVSTGEQTYRDYMIENELRNADMEAWFTGITEAAKVTVHNTSRLSRSLIMGS